MNKGQAGLSPKEIALMRSIRDGEVPRREVATMLDVPQPELTRLVKSLVSKGLIVVRRRGLSTSLAVSDTKHASILRRILNEYAHMRLEEILSLSSLRVISSLGARPLSTRIEIQSSSQVSPRTIHTVLKRLRAIGVVRTRGRGNYELADRFLLFADFARELASSCNQRQALGFSPDAVVVWERDYDFIVRTRAAEESEGFRKTAFSAFDGYGIPLVQEWHYYYHPHGSWQRTPDEVLLHSLTIRPLGSREMRAIKMLLDRKMSRRNINHLRKRAVEYGVEMEIERLIESLGEDRGDKVAANPHTEVKG